MISKQFPASYRIFMRYFIDNFHHTAMKCFELIGNALNDFSIIADESLTFLRNVVSFYSEIKLGSQDFIPSVFRQFNNRDNPC